MSDRDKLAIDFVKTIVMQLIAFSSAILALTVTFLKDLIPHPAFVQKTILLLCWSSHTMSVATGVWTLMALTGALQPKEAQSTEHLELEFPVAIYASNIRVPAGLQLFFFVCGIVFVFLLGATVILDVGNTSVTNYVPPVPHP